jgi:hypothetical protein
MTLALQTYLRSQIPVRMYFDGGWRFYRWIDECSLLNAENCWERKATISDIEVSLSFPMTGARYDNYMEFINELLFTWYIKRHIETSRTRPYHKNDNYYTEQKNYNAVRKTFGYFRFDAVEEYAA